MVTEKNDWLETNESKTETEHNGHEKMHALKPIKARTETEHNGHWKKYIVKNQWKQNRNWT